MECAYRPCFPEKGDLSIKKTNNVMIGQNSKKIILEYEKCPKIRKSCESF